MSQDNCPCEYIPGDTEECKVHVYLGGGTLKKVPAWQCDLHMWASDDHACPACYKKVTGRTLDAAELERIRAPKFTLDQIRVAWYQANGMGYSQYLKPFLEELGKLK